MGGGGGGGVSSIVTIYWPYGQNIMRYIIDPVVSIYGGKYVVMQYALRLTTAQISTFMCDLYPNDLV